MSGTVIRLPAQRVFVVPPPHPPWCAKVHPGPEHISTAFYADTSARTPATVWLEQRPGEDPRMCFSPDGARMITVSVEDGAALAEAMTKAARLIHP